MKTYLVDFENVKSKGLSGIDRLTDEDHVIIFYSENSDTISFEMHCMVLQAKADVDYMKVRVGGKNALDFQLSTLLGYLVAKGDNTHIFVISNDKGFDKLHDFWENTFDDSPACKVFRTSNISAAVNYARYNTVPVEEPEEPEPEPENNFPQLDAEVSGSYDEESKVVEFDLGEETEPEFAADEVIPPSVVSGIIAEAPKTHARSYTETQPAVKPIRSERQEREPVQKKYMPSMPKVIAPGVRHPMLAADESQAELYEPLFEKFLQTPEGRDKHALLAKFMPGIDGKAVEYMGKLILRSTSKSELHNLLQQKYDNETSAKQYNMVKHNYYFLKRVLREDDPKPAPVQEKQAQPAKQDKPAPAQEKQAQPAKQDKPAPVQEKQAQPAKQDKPAPAQEKQAQPAKQDKPAPAQEKQAQPAKQDKPAPVQEKQTQPAKQDKPAPAQEKQAQSAKQEKTDSAAAPETQTEAKKATAEFKKRLHEILDSKADADEFSGVISVVNASATKQQLYINMMQRFKRGRGTELYGMIKDEFVKFCGEEKTAKPAAVKKTKAAEKEKPAEKKTPAKKDKPAAKPKQEPAKTKKEKPAESKPRPKLNITKDNADDTLRSLCGEQLVDDLEFVRLRQLVTESDSAHKLYLEMIKTFGKKRGAAMYNAVKTVHAELVEAYK